MSKLTGLTVDQWHITLQGAANEILGAVFFKGTLADAKSAAITLRDTIAPGQQEITTSITSDTYGTASTCTGAQDWQDKEEAESDSIPRQQTDGKKKGEWIACIMVFILFVICLTTWSSCTGDTQKNQFEYVSEACSRWRLFSDDLKAPMNLRKSSLTTEAAVALYEQCRSDMQAHAKELKLKMPQGFEKTPEEMTKHIEVAKVTVVLGYCPRDWEDKVEEAVRARLKDPDSAKIRYGYPHDQARWEDGKRYVYGVVPIYVNAKNSFGAYTGETQWFAIFESGAVLTEILTQ